MNIHDVIIFEPYSFVIGQKINIAAGPRRGDWEVVGLTDKTVRLRCPISRKEFEWHRFCYVTEECSQVPWPKKD
ncbi:MAG: hypothetical protein U9Q38_06985 [Thermodesulfobacteriota bacterium]|nr:hypothetical protein [Thermodesulfobacteriota bacterium]